MMPYRRVLSDSWKLYECCGCAELFAEYSETIGHNSCK